MKFRHVLFDFTVASGLVLNVVSAGSASDSADRNRTVSYVPVAGHATGTLSGDVPLSQLGDYKLSRGEVSFDGNHITITSNSAASDRTMTLTGLVISPELSVHGKEVRYTSGVYFSRPTVAAIPSTTPLGFSERPQSQDTSNDSGIIEKTNDQAVLIPSKLDVVEKLKLRDGSEITGSIQRISNQAVTIITRQGPKRIALDKVTNIESPKMFIATVVGHASAAVEPGAPFQLHATKVELRPADQEKSRRRKGAGWLFGSGSSDVGTTTAATAVPTSIQGGQHPSEVVKPGIGSVASTVPLKPGIPSVPLLQHSNNAIAGGAGSSNSERLISYVPVAGHATGSLSGDAPLSQVGDYKLSQGLVTFKGDQITITSRTSNPNRPIVLSGLVMSPELHVHGKSVKYSSDVYFSRPSVASTADAPFPATIETLHLSDGSNVSGSIQKIGSQSVTILTKAGTRKVPLGTVTKIESPRLFVATVEGQATSDVEPGAPFQLRASKIEIRPIEEEKRRRRGGGWIVSSGALGIGATAGVAVPPSRATSGTVRGADSIKPTAINYAPVRGHEIGALSGDVPLRRIGDQKLMQGSISFDGNKLTVKSGTNALGQYKSLTGFVISPTLSVRGSNEVKYFSDALCVYDI